jgi:hypothetical protein
VKRKYFGIASYKIYFRFYKVTSTTGFGAELILMLIYSHCCNLSMAEQFPQAKPDTKIFYIIHLGSMFYFYRFKEGRNCGGYHTIIAR